MDGKISEPPAKKVKTGHCELVSLLEEHKKNDCDSTNIFRQLLNEYNFSNNANISYEKVDILFQEFTSLCKNDVLNEEVRLFMENDMSKLFGHRSVVQYFKHNLESYCSIIALLMVKCDLDALLVFLQNENTFSKKIVTENEFYKYFLDINLPVFVSIVEKYNDPRLFNEVCEVFKKCILNKNSGEFENYLDQLLKLSENKLKEKFNIPKKLIRTLSSSYILQNQEANITHKIIFHSLFSSYKFSLIYKFLIVITELLGFNLDRDFQYHKISKYSYSDLSLKKSLGVISDILEIFKNREVDLSCSVNIEFSQFIENIINSVISLSQCPNAVCYRILKFSIEIHPLLVERNLNNLLRYSMLANNDSFSMEYANFLLEIFKTYAKLHRIQNLISKMLPILKSSIEKKEGYEEYYSFRGTNDCNQEIEQYFCIQKILPENVLNYFSECVVQMASWQVMNLFKTFIFHLESAVGNFGGSYEESQNNFIELLCKLSSWLLRSIRMAENTVTTMVTQNFNDGMKQLKDILNKLGEALLKQEHNQTLVAAFLNLSYDWSEMYMIFHYYRGIEENSLNMHHLDYIHSFLSTEQWALLSQRITNFGESNCKTFMLKLFVQKLRTMRLFGKQMNEEIRRETIEYISYNIENNCEYIISEKFIDEHLIHELDFDLVILMAERVYSNFKNEKIPVQIINSRTLSNALTYVILSKLSKSFKTRSSSLLPKIFSNIDKTYFFIHNEDAKEYFITLKNIYEQNLWEADEYLRSVDKIQTYLNWLKRLPIPYLSPNIQSMILLCMFSLHRNLWNTKNNELKSLIEDIIIGVLQSGKVDLTHLFDPISLMKNIIFNFTKKDITLSLLSGNVIKGEVSLRYFIPGINYLLDHSDHSDNLEFSIFVLNNLLKVWKSKISKEFHVLCTEVKDLILNKHLEIVTSTKADLSIIQSYVVCLKYYMGICDDKYVSKLVDLLESFLTAILSSETHILPKGSISLFATVLNNKEALKMPSDLPLRIWKFCKTKEVSPKDVEEFSQVICSVYEHIPNEEFENIVEDLWIMIEEPIQKEDFSLMSKQLGIWSYILTSSFNPVKVKIWHKALEKLLFNLSLLKNRMQFSQQVFDEIMDFEIAVIRHNQLSISSTIMGIFLMSPVIVLQKSDSFYDKFHKCSDYIECLLKYRNSLIMDRLPTFLRLFRLLLSNLCEECKRKDQNIREINKLAECAHQLEKLTRHLVLFKKHIARIAPHLIADILHQYEGTNLYPKVKIHLNNCIYSLISQCDHHAVSYLRRVLSSASTEMFKIMLDNYRKFYRFTGKV